MWEIWDAINQHFKNGNCLEKSIHILTSMMVNLWNISIAQICLPPNLHAWQVYVFAKREREYFVISKKAFSHLSLFSLPLEYCSHRSIPSYLLPGITMNELSKCWHKNIGFRFRSSLFPSSPPKAFGDIANIYSQHQDSISISIQQK